MKYQLFSFFLLFTLFTFSQTSFQKGYVIKTNGERIDCLIKNDDWKNNPTQFTYKLTDNSEILIGNLELIKEFSIENESKFIKQKLDIDISSNNLKNLGYVKEPNWENRTVYLKVLLEGESSLYYYAAPGLNRYFYNIQNGKIIQLIYKRYYVEHQKVKSNIDFKQQLLNSYSSCNTLDLQDFENVNYNAPSLSKIVKSYNNCLNAETVSFVKSESGLKFNLKVKGGLNNTTVKNVNNPYIASRSVSFESMLGYRFALEGEIILPFNNNKWGLLFELGKNQKATKDGEAVGGKATFSYDSFDGLFGMRHYLYINKSSRASIHLGYAWDLASDLKLDYDFHGGNTIEGENVSGSFLFGVGYHFQKISIEARVNIKKPIFEVNTALYKSDSNTLNLTVGYTIL